MNGVSVAVDETAREIIERAVFLGCRARERVEQQRPITTLKRLYSLFCGTEVV